MRGLFVRCFSRPTSVNFQVLIFILKLDVFRSIAHCELLFSAMQPVFSPFRHRRDLPFVLDQAICSFLSLLDLGCFFWASRSSAYCATTCIRRKTVLDVDTLAWSEEHFADAKFILGLAFRQCRSLREIYVHVRWYKKNSDARFGWLRKTIDRNRNTLKLVWSDSFTFASLHAMLLCPNLERFSTNHTEMRGNLPQSCVELLHPTQLPHICRLKLSIDIAGVWSSLTPDSALRVLPLLDGMQILFPFRIQACWRVVVGWSKLEELDVGYVETRFLPVLTQLRLARVSSLSLLMADPLSDEQTAQLLAWLETLKSLTKLEMRGVHTSNVSRACFLPNLQDLHYPGTAVRAFPKFRTLHLRSFQVYHIEKRPGLAENIIDSVHSAPALEKMCIAFSGDGDCDAQARAVAESVCRSLKAGMWPRLRRMFCQPPELERLVSQGAGDRASYTTARGARVRKSDH